MRTLEPSIKEENEIPSRTNSTISMQNNSSVLNKLDNKNEKSDQKMNEFDNVKTDDKGSESENFDAVSIININSLVDVSSPQSFTLIAYDGQSHNFASIGTQTASSWLVEDELRSRSTTTVGGLGVAGSEAGDVFGQHMESLHEEDGGRASNKKNFPHKPSSQRSKSSINSSAVRAALARSKHLIPPYPEPRVDDEFGIPLYDSEDELDVDDPIINENNSPFEENFEKQAGRITRQLAAAKEGIIPSVGPPQILQYLREDDGEVGRPDSPSIRIQQIQVNSGGQCQFCGKAILQIPSMDEQLNQPPEGLYCCQEYSEQLQYALAQAAVLAANVSSNVGIIDIAPHPPHGNQKARKDAKEKADKRAREREMIRQQQAMLAAQANLLQAKKIESDLTLTRQMKTINYQLSNLKCLDKGWTLRAPSPMQEDNVAMEMFQIDMDHVINLADILSARDTTKMDVFQKYYPEGNKFLIIFRDGSGNIFYPSGNTAVSIVAVQPGRSICYVFDDLIHSEAAILGVFDTIGHGTSYYKDGSFRLCYDQLEGLEHEQSTGARRKRWHWSVNGGLHSHAPPFQPLRCILNRAVSLRLTSRENVTLCITANARSVKLQVGAKLRPLEQSLLGFQTSRISSLSASKTGIASEIGPLQGADEDITEKKTDVLRHANLSKKNLPNQPYSLRPDYLRLEELRLRAAELLEHANLLLQHPRHPRPQRLPTSLHLENRRLRLERSSRPPLVQ